MLSKAELWSGLFWIAAGLFVASSGLDLEIGILQQPGSGFALFFIGLLMVALALSLTVKSLMRASPTLSSLWQDAQWRKVASVSALLIVYGLTFETVGFFLCTVALLLILMLWVDPVDWRVATIVSVGAAWSVDYALTHWLKISVPDGILTGWI